MKMIVAALMGLVFLTACGADGPPERPAAKTQVAS